MTAFPGGLKVVDADRHVIEPIELWQQYLEPEFRAGAPVLEVRVPRESLTDRVARLGEAGLWPLPPTLLLDGAPLMRNFGETAQLELARQLMLDPIRQALAARPQDQLWKMDKEGVAEAYLYPSFTTYLLGVEHIDPVRSEAFARAYNRWLRDYCANDPERLHGVGLISRHTLEGMMQALEEVADWGFRAIVLRPNPIRGRTLGDPAYEPFWSRVEALNLAVGIHEGAHTFLPTAGADRFSTHFANIAASHPLEQMMAFLSLLEAGVLERHPGLRVAFLEAGSGWLPFWLWRLDGLWQQGHWEVRDQVRQAPSAYFRRQCYITVEPEEPGIEAVVASVGHGCLLYCTDFPHLDHDAAGLARALGILSERLTPELVRAILEENPRRFYQSGVR